MRTPPARCPDRPAPAGRGRRRPSAGPAPPPDRGEVVVYSARIEHADQADVRRLHRQDRHHGPGAQRERGGAVRAAQGRGGGHPGRRADDGRRRATSGSPQQAGLLQGFQSPVIEKNIPAHLRARTNDWVGLSVRARTIAYSTERVKPDELSTYEALGDPEVAGPALPPHVEEGLQPVDGGDDDQDARREADRGDRAGLGGQRAPHLRQRHQAPGGHRRRPVRRRAGQHLLPGPASRPRTPSFPVALFWPNQKDRACTSTSRAPA